MAHGCKRAGGFVDSGCNALCDCHVTLPVQVTREMFLRGAGGMSNLKAMAERTLALSDARTPRYGWAIPNRLYGAEINHEGDVV